MTTAEPLTRDDVRHLRLGQFPLPISLAGENLTGANLRGEQLEETDFTGANLTGVDFTGANLTGANFTGANLTNATFTYADLDQANLTDAILADTNFTNAQFTGIVVQRGACEPLLFLPTINGWQVYCGGWRGTLDEQRRWAAELGSYDRGVAAAGEGAYLLAAMDMFAAYQDRAHDSTITFSERWGFAD